MGQKVNPHGLRVGVIKDWDSRWYAREEKVGDLIVKMGDTNVTTLASLTPAVKKYKVGDTTTLTVYRSGKLLELTITFGEKPHGEVQLPQQETQAPTQSTVPEDGNFKEWWDRFFGEGNS